MSILHLYDDALHNIAGYLDPISVSSLRLTCRKFSKLAADMTGYALPASLQSLTGQNVATTSVHFNLPDSPSSSSNIVDLDSLASSDTDMTSSPEEEEWEFEVTPDMMRRLSILPQRSHGPSLSSMPTELQLEVFSYLDQIDSCCLGLASPNLYVVYRAIHGTKMPLTTRRNGPNPLESCWEVVGKRECQQCGTYRCQLHQHIRTWMPKNMEYCAMKQNFGLRAKDGANDECFRGKPSKPKRCGRHPLRTTSVHQDDASFAITTL